jgi:hypothetical protein
MTLKNLLDRENGDPVCQPRFALTERVVIAAWFDPDKAGRDDFFLVPLDRRQMHPGPTRPGLHPDHRSPGLEVHHLRQLAKDATGISGEEFIDNGVMLGEPATPYLRSNPT